MTIHRKISGSLCLICTIELQPKEGFLLHQTHRQRHKLCMNCASEYIKRSIIDKIINNNYTMTVSCCGNLHGHYRNKCNYNIPISPISIQDLSHEVISLVDKLERLNSGKWLECPACKALVEVEYTNIPENTQHTLQCTHCLETWCLDCKAYPFHSNKTCTQYALSQRNDIDSTLKDTIKDMKPCPSCGYIIDKESGTCNKIVCAICHCKWCWLCYEKHIDYDHFNYLKVSSCANKLFL